MRLRSRLRAVATRLPAGPSLARLAAGTTALTFVLMVLGVWTAAGGYGLTCEGRWPFCDGAVAGLFPANFGSFVEWFHRAVAMVTGFAILGTAALAWVRRADRTARVAFTLALLLTPAQIVLGAMTVGSYERLILAAHFGSALAIVALLAGGTARVADGLPARRRLAGVGAGAATAGAVLAPDVLLVHPVWLHLVYVALALAAFLALLLASLAPGSWDGARIATAAGTGAIAVALIVGRVRLDATGKLVVLAGLGAGAVLALAAFVLLGRPGSPGTTPAPGGA